MSIARHHAEWLSLVPVSGPFLSMPVLMQAFPQGLEAKDAEVMRSLRQTFAEWEDGPHRKPDPVVQSAWVGYVLTQLLDLDESLLLKGQQIPQTLQVEVPEHAEFLKPNIVLNDPNRNKPRLLIQTYPRSQSLTNYVANSLWKVSPDTRMTELLHATGVSLGIVTNGEHWMLVHAPKGETAGYASWYASLWIDEPITFQAFRTLLSAERFFSVDDESTLEALLEKSASNQQELTDQLGYQVRRAVEVLIHSLDKADQDFGGKLLADVDPTVLYESALTVMMRLVFLFCAEERELIPGKPFPVFEQNYSVSAISKQLREVADQLGEELLERRGDAWPRLLACFRMIYGGVFHEDIQIPAYGGKLFDPDRFPFLEGRPSGTSWEEVEAKPLPVNNRTVLHLLEALQILQIKVPGAGPAEARRLSFRALDIEQIGHVYEGLLDHTAKRADKPYLGLAGTRDKEPEIPLSKLEEIAVKGEAELITFLKEKTGRSESALKKAFTVELEMRDVARLRAACQSEELWRRVEPFAGLIRDDSFGYPVVIPRGSVFVTAGTDRRSSGTHYTPRSLTEPIVQYTLEPLVYVGPAEGHPKAEWKLKSPKELLELKICDMACGSGAFLVQAARYMSERLMEAWANAELVIKSDGTEAMPAMTPFGERSTGANKELIPVDPAERKTYAMRIIAQGCLYGVDKNPLAVEMAKLSLWLLTLAKDKPFEFLDHSIRCGDSLVGIHNLDQLRSFDLRAGGDVEVETAKIVLQFMDDRVNEAIELRSRIVQLPPGTVEDVVMQERMHREASEKIERLKVAADMLVGAEFLRWDQTDEISDELLNEMESEDDSVRWEPSWVKSKKTNAEFRRIARIQASMEVGIHFQNDDLTELQGKSTRWLSRQPTFHWPLEFPEVIVTRGGFDAFVCNPPFMGGKTISGHLGKEYLGYLKHLWSHQKGSADYAAYFFLQAFARLRSNGVLGMISTNSIAQGDTRAVGLDYIDSLGGCIYRADNNRPWPGLAAVVVSVLHISRRQTNGRYILDGQSVDHISTLLDEQGKMLDPERLLRNRDLAFQGTIVLGEGFILEPAEAELLVKNNAKNADVLFPYLDGQDLNSRPDQTPSRWIINFRDWSFRHASEFPECLSILTDRVKPYRDEVVSRGKQIHEYDYWKFWDKRLESYERLAGLSRVLVVAQTSRTLAFAFVPNGYVYSMMTIVFPYQEASAFAVLQSCFHELWARRYASTMKEDLRYTPSKVFETFPMPIVYRSCNEIGETYHMRRKDLMVKRKEGLTKTYNRFHDPNETAADVQKLRDLHVELDQTVAVAYGWDDFELGHGFHEAKQGVRFTISESARHEVLQRLLRLNHERYAEEVAEGLHDKKGKERPSTTNRKKKSQVTAPTLFEKDVSINLED
jgi:hypothetical protein